MGRNCLKQNVLKKIMKENGVLSLITCVSQFRFWHLLDLFSMTKGSLSFVNSIMALRKAEKEEEKRAREKIRQKLEEDKVLVISLIS